MLLTACEQFLGKPKQEIQEIALHTLEGHQRAIMGSMTVEVCLCLKLLAVVQYALEVQHSICYIYLIFIC